MRAMREPPFRCSAGGRGTCTPPEAAARLAADFSFCMDSTVAATTAAGDLEEEEFEMPEPELPSEARLEAGADTDEVSAWSFGGSGRGDTTLSGTVA